MAKRCPTCGTYYIDDEAHNCETERISRRPVERRRPEAVRRRVALMLVPAAVQVAIQFVGLINTFPNSHPIPLGRLYWWVVGTAAVLSLLAPALSVAALSELRRTPDEDANTLRAGLMVAAVLLVATSWLGFGLTYLMHPMWMGGYDGK